MRYLKVFLLVLIFLLVMMFFVQNQTSFADDVVLHLDLMFTEPMQSLPIPMYALMLICFTLGALIVLAMLMWDRLTMMGRVSSAKHKVTSLEKKLQATEAKLAKAEADHREAENKLRDELRDAEQRVNAALRAAKTEEHDAGA